MEEFLENIIPGNYFLTKSMEFTKERTSGTLWYLKKYLVLYYNIFLTDTIATEDGINNIIHIFENFIDSVPEGLKEEATKFFFPAEVDIRGNYNKFVHFKGNKMFANVNEENKYMNTVKKYYFVYLMQLGGQGGVNAYIKKYLYQQDFSMEKIDDIITEYLQQYSIDKTIHQIKADYHATLRNERQMLWYYGFFHSKSTGSIDTEFSSLTPVGAIAIKANYDEFRLIWEHQKLKMISQPVTVIISNISKNPYVDENKFSINYSPYMTILKCLKNNGRISKDYYKYILSRSNNINKEIVINNYEELNQQLNRVKEIVNNFDRETDTKTEDFDKELKKYILGIRDDLNKDEHKNSFGVCSCRNGLVLNNAEKLEKIVKVYEQIDKYKIKKNEELFKKCENELKNKYKAKKEGIDYQLNAKTKIMWDLYNIHFEKAIVIALILLDYSIDKNIEFEEIILDNEVIRNMQTKYKNLLEGCNLRRIKEIATISKIVYMTLLNGDLENLKLEEENIYENVYVNEHTSLSTSDLQEKIKEISKENVSNTMERTRSIRLINLIKLLYKAKYSDRNKLIKCECCGKTTFLTSGDEAYLEYHHLIPFNIADGPDHYINIYGICPDCHRRVHYGNDNLKADIYHNFNIHNHLNKTIEERFKELYHLKALKSYQLEYALVEQMITEGQYNEILA